MSRVEAVPSNRRMKLSQRDGRVNRNGLVLIAAAALHSLAAVC